MYLYQNGKSLVYLILKYNVSISSITKWINQFSEVKINNVTILSSKQIHEFHKCNALLEEENLI